MRAARPLLRFVWITPLALSAGASAQVFDLTSSWSDTLNPNGAWSSRVGTTLLSPVDSFTGDTWGTPQKGFTPGALLPAVFQSNGTEQFTHDWVAGDVIMHSTSSNGVASQLANIAWTSPYTGRVSIAGATWPCRDIGRANTWRVRLRSSVLTQGDVSSGDAYSRANPFDWSAGSGGAGALQNLDINAGDEIVWELESTATSPFGDYAGVRFTLTYCFGVSAPAPSTVLCQGGTLRLSAQGVGPGGVALRWQRETSPGVWNNLNDGAGAGVGMVSGSSTGNLVVTGVTPSATGRYRCRVTSECGSTESTPASVSVACVGNRADVAGLDGGAGCDGRLSASDVVVFFRAFFDGCPGGAGAPCNPADITDVSGTGAPDGQLTASDVVRFFSSFFAGCNP